MSELKVDNHICKTCEYYDPDLCYCMATGKHEIYEEDTCDCWTKEGDE